MTMVVKRFTLSDFSMEPEDDDTKKEETRDVITDNLGEIGRYEDSSHNLKSFFVKLQSKLNCSVQVGQGVDFVFPLSQQ